MYNDEQNLYHYTYRKDGTEPGQRYDARQPGVDDQLNSYRQQQAQAQNQAYQFCKLFHVLQRSFPHVQVQTARLKWRAASPAVFHYATQRRLSQGI